MDPWKALRIHAAGRAAIGAALVAAPRALGAVWVGADAARPSAAVYSGALGARDLGIGLGLLGASRAGHGTRPWIAAGMLGDAVDLAITVRHRGDLPAFGVASVGVLAGSSTALGAWLYRRLD